MRNDDGAAERIRLDIEGVSKHYGLVQALDDIHLTLRGGQVHGLCGANGAGKSTLVKVLAGVVHQDKGAIRIDGAAAKIAKPADAENYGIQFLHQELLLFPGFTALEHLGIRYGGGSRFGVLRRGALLQRARAVMADLGVDFPLDVDIDRLSVPQRWLVAVGRSLMSNARLIVMDEPSASFTQHEVDLLFGIIDRLRDRGVGVVYVSHRLDEVVSICDCITVMRDGRIAETFDGAAVSRSRLAEAIVGRSVDRQPPQDVLSSEQLTRPVFQAHGLAAMPRVVDVSFEVHHGEILGLAGLVGAGRTELATVIAGAVHPDRGSMLLEGKPFRPSSPRQALRDGVALVPEERRSQGLLLDKSVVFNGLLSTMDRFKRPWSRVLRQRQMETTMAAQIERYGILASTRQTVSLLSGGNQQKVVVARVMQAEPKLLVLDEPTVGMDVGAREELYKIIVELAASGSAILMIASDLEELELCHRVLVMREGRITREVRAPAVTKDLLTEYCYEEVVQ